VAGDLAVQLGQVVDQARQSMAAAGDAARQPIDVAVERGQLLEARGKLATTLIEALA
jgi:hypothetical protein